MTLCTRASKNANYCFGAAVRLSGLSADNVSAVFNPQIKTIKG